MTREFLAQLLNLEENEGRAVASGFAMFFLLFAGYFMLRPVRETMGIEGGVDNLRWLFTGTFLATLAALPLFGWVASRVARRRILYWVFGFFAGNLALFGLSFLAVPDDPWIARAFYIWLSVFNLIAISVGWSVLVDLFAIDQAKRLFALIAAGASVGGIVGPVLAILLVEPLGHVGLLFLSAALLVAAAFAALNVQHWRDAYPVGADDAGQRARPLGGNPLAGAVEVVRSPYQLAIGTFILLLASASTFLYFEQARLVEQTFSQSWRRTQVFGTIDLIVQALALLTQLFVTGHVARRMGLGVLLAAVPLAVAVGFLWLAIAPVFMVLAVVMVFRRAGEYALVRPGREMLYTVVEPEAKYKAKNFNDTIVYRGADAVSGWVKTAIDQVGQQPALAMMAGTGIAVIWAYNGWWLARAHRRHEMVDGQAERPG